MADTSNNQAKETRTFINLPCIYLSSRKIRFLLVDNEANVKIPAQTNFEEVSDTPLFLACDILAGTELQPKNFNRVYLKYARKGLACKISPKNFRLVGIKNGNLWFYNIQGLFQIVFQYQAKGVQKCCLTVLKDVWLNQYGAGPLQDSLSVSLSSSARDETVLYNSDPLLCNTAKDGNFNLQINKHIHVPRDITPTKADVSPSGCHGDSSVVVDNGFVIHGTLNLQERELSSVKKLNSRHRSECMGKGCQNSFIRSVDEGTDKAVDLSISTMTPVSASEVHFVVSYPEKSEITTLEKHVQTDSQAVKQKCCQTDRKMCNVSTQTDTQGDIYRLDHDTFQFCDSCCRFLDPVALACKGDRGSYKKKMQTMLQMMKLEVDNESFLSVISHLYLDTVKDLDNKDMSLTNIWKVSEQKYAFLSTICSWLGNELHEFEPVISQNVEKFKKDNINCIDNLPSSEAIIDLIFPPFMKELILNWTGQGHLLTSHSSLNDHNYQYSPPNKKLRLCGSGGICFPLVQHILEFTNNALVSGVAHVVYCRLRHSQ